MAGSLSPMARTGLAQYPPSPHSCIVGVVAHAAQRSMMQSRSCDVIAPSIYITQPTKEWRRSAVGAGACRPPASGARYATPMPIFRVQQHSVNRGLWRSPGQDPRVVGVELGG
jgi:hypothetical protein